MPHYTEMPPVHTQADLEQHWRTVMGPLGFSETLIWMAFFDVEGRVTPLLPQLADLPDEPSDLGLSNVMLMARMVIEQDLPGGSVAFLRTRPGRGGFTAADRAWASGLARAAHAAGLGRHAVHLANHQELRVFALDDATL